MIDGKKDDLTSRKSTASTKNNDSRKETGRMGEEAACRYLAQEGYRIRERNWRCRSGEIDVIAEHEGRIVFVEVRTRSMSTRFGTAAESVDRRKQLRVRGTAQVYMRSCGLADASVRFDVIALTLNKQDGSVIELKHYESAF